jgi:hypothetical protein
MSDDPSDTPLNRFMLGIIWVLYVAGSVIAWPFIAIGRLFNPADKGSPEREEWERR